MYYWKKYLIVTGILLLWTGLHIYWQSSLHVPVALESKTISIHGIVVDDPIIKPASTRFLFKSEAYGVVQLDWYRNAPHIQNGQEWSLNVRLKNPRNYNNPGGFDYARFLFLKRISATGYVYEREPSTLLFSPPDKISIRQHIAQKIDDALDARPHAALIKGLAVGIRDTMSDAQWELLQKTGTSHLLAISGLHIGLVSGLIFFLVRYLWARLSHIPLYLPAPIVAAIAAIIAAFIYAALAGFAIPTQRAFIMILVVMCSIISRYHFKQRDILLFAGILVVLWDPFALMSASFWLSFIAVGLLFATSLQQAPKWYQYLSIQWYISLGLTPLVIAYFNQISWVSPFANFIAIPWASFTVVPLTLLGVFASFFSQELATLFWLLAESALNYLDGYLNFMANFSWSWQPYVVSDHVVWFAIILSAILLLVPKGVPGKILGVILLLSIIFVQHPKPEAKEIWLSVLDVGQGLSVVVQTKDHVLLYDAGMRFDQFDLGEAVIKPFLQHQGIKKIDTLVLSHDNLDHTGGALHLLKHFQVENIISGEAITDIPNTSRCRQGQSWQWNQVDFKFLYPETENSKNSNNNSCVLKITAGDHSALLTGDIEREGEEWLVSHFPTELKTHILLAPHHGSKTSSSIPFVRATNPAHVIFSTGYLNRYGFPRQEIQSRYTARGAIAHNTAEKGAIRFRFSPSSLLHLK